MIVPSPAPASSPVPAVASLQEDDSEYADSRILEQYRAARVAELKAAAARNKFGGVRHISRDDFTVEVNDASKEAWVVVLLYKDGVPNSKYLEAFIPRVRTLLGCGSQRNGTLCSQSTSLLLLLQPTAANPVQLAAAHKATKFVRIVADQCIAGFKDE